MSAFTVYTVNKDLAEKAIEILGDSVFLKLYDKRKSELRDDVALSIYDGSRALDKQITYHLIHPDKYEDILITQPLPGTSKYILNADNSSLENINARLWDFYRQNQGAIDEFTDVDAL